MAVFYYMIYKIFSILVIATTFSFPKEAVKITDSLTTIEFSFVGDIMCHSTQFNYARVESDSFDFKPVFREIKPYLKNADVVVGNLETVIEVEDVKFSGYPVFNTPQEFLEGLKFAGFDFLSTTNNHAYDIRERGVLSTIRHIHNYGMNNIGTFTSQKQRDSVRIFKQNKIKYAILSYTYGVNLYKIPEESNYLVNRINEDIIRKDISAHRAAGADIIITFFHFGKEYSKSANEYQKDVVNVAIDSGADIIVGAHPHTLQPIEYFKSNSGNIDEGFVAYSLGNFVSNQRWRYSDGGAVLNFSVSKNHNTGKISLSGVRYLPIWVFKGQSYNGLEYVILPTEIAKQKSYLSEDDIQSMNECYLDTKNILLSFTNLIEIDSISKSNKRKQYRELQINKYLLSRIHILEKCNQLLKPWSDTLQYMKADTSLSNRLLNGIQ